MTSAAFGADDPAPRPVPPAARQQWLRVLALSDPATLAELVDGRLSDADFRWLRRPETGLVMAQGRIGNSGDRFNLAEVTVTRCVVQSRWQTAGVGYVTGRRPGHAARVARLDALLQVATLAPALQAEIIAPLAAGLADREAAEAAAAAASRVDFYTLASETTE
ncbi:MAG: phosphonate C-P lyase system protein PhnG [Lautropia sp.]